MRRAWLAEAVRAADGGRGLTRAWCSLAVAVGVTVLVAVAAMAQEAPRVSADTAGTPADAGALFDAVVERIGKSFWDKELIASSGWERRAAEVRPNVLAAPTREAAAGRINALLAELKTSHTGLFTPDDVEYYILLDVFSGSSRIRDFVAQHEDFFQ